MPGYLLQHVVKESQSGRHLTLSASIHPKLYIDIRLLRHPVDSRRPLTSEQKLCDTVPVGSSQHTDLLQVVRESLLFLVQPDGTTPEILRQLHVGQAVADDIAARQIVFIRKVTRQHGCPRLARRGVLLRERTVNELPVKINALACQRLHHQTMYSPEGLFREGRSSQSILVGDQGKLKVQLPADERQVADDTRIELQLLIRIQLVIDRRFQDQRPVTVNKQYFLFHRLIFKRLHGTRLPARHHSPRTCRP